MAGQIHERHQLAGALAQRLRIAVVRIVEHRAGVIEAERLVRDARRPAGPDLVHVPEHVQAGAAAAVVAFALRQDAEQRGLAGAGAAQNRAAHLDAVLVVGHLADEHLGDGGSGIGGGSVRSWRGGGDRGDGCGAWDALSVDTSEYTTY